MLVDWFGAVAGASAVGFLIWRISYYCRKAHVFKLFDNVLFFVRGNQVIRRKAFADIADRTGYVRDKHEYDLGEQRNQMAQTYVEYLYQTAQECSNNGDENGMLAAFDQLSLFAPPEEV